MKLNLMQETILKAHKRYKTFVGITARRMGKSYLMNMLAEKYLKEGKKVLRIGSGLNQSVNSIIGKNFDIRLFDEPCTIKDFRNLYMYSYSKKTLILGSPDINTKEKPSFFKFLYETWPSISFPYTTQEYIKENLIKIKQLLPKNLFNSEYLCEWKK